jgi:hypothetical protein
MVREIAFGPFRLIESERRLLKDGQPVAAGGRSLDLLLALVARAGEVVNRRELMDRVWPDVTVDESNLRAHITGLRKTLGDGQNDARYIVCLALGALIVALFIAAGSAQTGHGKYHDGFYSRWLTKQGYSCCSNKDCRPISANNVRVLIDKTQVLLDGEWVDVRPDAIRPYAAPDMSSHVCASGKYIFCFVYGSGA